ncbi:MAG: RNA polymerase sigma-70 factor [Nakamurella sp.]
MIDRESDAEPVVGPASAADPTLVFAAHRPLLFTIAYEITGSAADAEDVVQDSWLRWAEVDQAAVRSPRAYLAQIVTRQALNRLRSAARRREEYVGPWLPEPLLTAPDVADDVVLAESVSMAMMVVLETLTPDERAVFVLREVFGFSHDEIAAAIGRNAPAVRQIAHRARSHVRARRPVAGAAASAETEEAILHQFLTATSTGDLQGLMDLLAPDVVLITDGGGIRQAALRPILGADKTARFLIGVMSGLGSAEVQIESVRVNGEPGSVVRIGDVTDTVGSVAVVDGRIAAIHLVRNPDKLRTLVRRPLTR